MPGNPLPDAEQLLQALIEQMRPTVGPETGLIGIHTGGVWVAERLHQALGVKVPLAALDVSFYRDDYQSRGLHRDVQRSDISFEVEERDLVLVDDVLYTGRTIRAALNEIFDYGRPGRVQLAALIDRGGRQLPIAADFLGATAQLQPGQSVELTRDAEGRLKLVLHEEKP
ncbi:MAG: bifunctional pyr operon transcriptional regulator/uracil phosphoribosyltransferase PyrR [Betaproteobacteria bacterium]|nr:bifunctional pyr operon transcriptional regulator/uracil phosphoribosyltransferase PyrR [Betaproteobacteria bacterium]MDH3437227.1 bifunctional pyr operon transcriptional regulator/uracil phosphoribosyltransferase PyrR [Betaproteobacteria bacterium]